MTGSRSVFLLAAVLVVTGDAFVVSNDNQVIMPSHIE
jgi:hypothetical protein